MFTLLYVAIMPLLLYVTLMRYAWHTPSATRASPLLRTSQGILYADALAFITPRYEGDQSTAECVIAVY